ncbi:MAG: hypothetical protein JWO43_559 [Candidatus Adlerbacteria bacterium]|nr:hypothetical protein [Candidatus Adlerbacteria bacterium]
MPNHKTISDLAEDFSELSLLTTSARKRLAEYMSDLHAQRSAYLAETYEYMQRQAQELASAYEILLKEVQAERAAQSGWDTEDLPRLYKAKRKHSDLLRVLQSSLGATVTSGSWQAPSFTHTSFSEAGNRTGEVHVNQDDYVRDYYPAEEYYAQLFAKEYVDHPNRLPPRTLLTSSCMAALTTVLNNTFNSNNAGAYALVGATSYFQNKWVAEKLFPGKVIYVDEFDTDNLLAQAAKYVPSVILLDSIAGTESLAMPHLERLIPELSRMLPPTSTIVLDVTASATMHQPLRYLPIRPFGPKLVMIASLSKYYQFGFDRVTAGAIWTPMDLDLSLGITRRQLGTNIPDASLFALPMPCRPILDLRLKRMGRNARLLAERLDTYTNEVDGPISHMVYPSLPSYRGYSWTKDAAFHGGVCTFAFKPGKDSPAEQEAFAKRVFVEAKRRGIQLVGGAGFGYNTTRLYFISKQHVTANLRPFVRIAAGTETLDEIDLLTEVFKSAMLSK